MGSPKASHSGVASANQRKASSWTFPGGIPEQKFEMWIVLVFLRKNTRIHKNGRNSWTFRFGPFFGLVCRGDSWVTSKPVSRIFRSFRFFVSAVSAFSAFCSVKSPQTLFFSGVIGTVRIVRIFAVSGSNRWFENPTDWLYYDRLLRRPGG